MSPLVRSLLALAALLATADAVFYIARFGFGYDEMFSDYIEVKRVLPATGDTIILKPPCKKGQSYDGLWIKATNGVNDRDPYIYGEKHVAIPQNITVTCNSLGPLDKCTQPIHVHAWHVCHKRRENIQI